jgi:hypothetical protein
MPKKDGRPDLTFRAPILSVDLDPFGWDIWPCHECLPWHVEFVRVEDEYCAREWHAAECPRLAELLNPES